MAQFKTRFGTITIATPEEVQVSPKWNPSSDGAVSNKAIAEKLKTLNILVNNIDELNTITPEDGIWAYVANDHTLYAYFSNTSSWEQIVYSSTDIVFDENIWEQDTEGHYSLKVTDEVTENNKSLVTSGGVYTHVDNKIGQIEEVVKRI